MKKASSSSCSVSVDTTPTYFCHPLLQTKSDREKAADKNTERYVWPEETNYSWKTHKYHIRWEAAMKRHDEVYRRVTDEFWNICWLVVNGNAHWFVLSFANFLEIIFKICNTPLFLLTEQDIVRLVVFLPWPASLYLIYISPVLQWFYLRFTVLTMLGLSQGNHWEYINISIRIYIYFKTETRHKEYTFWSMSRNVYMIRLREDNLKGHLPITKTYRPSFTKQTYD